MPSSSSAPDLALDRSARSQQLLPATFMLHFSWQSDCIWQELSASQLPAVLSPTTDNPAPDAARKVPTGPDLPSALWDGDKKEHTDPPSGQRKLMPETRRDPWEHLKLPEWSVPFQLSMESRAKAQTVNLQVELPWFGQIQVPFILLLRNQRW